MRLSGISWNVQTSTPLIGKGYVLSGEIALKNNHYYYYKERDKVLGLVRATILYLCVSSVLNNCSLIVISTDILLKRKNASVNLGPLCCEKTVTSIWFQYICSCSNCCRILVDLNNFDFKKKLDVLIKTELSEKPYTLSTCNILRNHY